VKPTLYIPIELDHELLSNDDLTIGHVIATAATPTATAIANTTAVNTEDIPLFLAFAFVFGFIGSLRLGF
jgi:hypothetical protein